MYKNSHKAEKYVAKSC